MRCGKVWDSTMENALRKVNTIPGRPLKRPRSRPTERRRPGRRGCAQKRDQLKRHSNGLICFLFQKVLRNVPVLRKESQARKEKNATDIPMEILATNLLHTGHALTAGSGQISATLADAVGEAT